MSYFPCLNFIAFRCDNGLVMWLPLEQDSVTAANGMLISAGSHVEHLKIVKNGTWGAMGTGEGKMKGHHCLGLSN